MSVLATRDEFEPRHEPARSLYQAFKKAAKERKSLTVLEEIQAELVSIHQESARTEFGFLECFRPFR